MRNQDNAPRRIYLKDYRRPPYQVREVELRIELLADHTLVHGRLRIERASDEPVTTPLTLHGADLEVVQLAIDGDALAPERYHYLGEELVIADVPAAFWFESTVRIYPARNTALEGLYLSNGMYCTQCEAEGFRKISWYLDRPDVMAVFTTTIEADKAQYPLLLANGNLIHQGELDGGRHSATWHDPFPKPSYLFAMVAGNLACLEDEFVTASGRRVALRLYAEAHDIDKCQHAMHSLKAAMRWDEERYGREYDLDVFMVVAVSHFNMGAMENKGLNIFNTSCVLADPRTATDIAFQRVESVVAHEYFHNWTGNRITCRDWFQLCLKEGFTVFRDQQFSADQLSADVQRIEDVVVLRTHQFSEDAGPLAHPVRPEFFVEINNFYTATVYEKGAELARMLHTLLGEQAFRQGSDLYFARHDGQAVTVEDFIQAFADASGRDLSQFLRWYRQPGTPTLSVTEDYDAGSQAYRLRVRQELPVVADYEAPQPLLIPIRMALFQPDGQPALIPDEQGRPVTERLLVLDQPDAEWQFTGLAERPVLSILRGLSAPVRLAFERSDQELIFLLRHETSGFDRWEAAQQLILRELLAVLNGERPQLCAEVFRALADSVRALVGQDDALAAKLLALPGESLIAEQLPVFDPDQIHAVREQARQLLAVALAEVLPAWALSAGEPYQYTASAIGRRALRLAALDLLLVQDASRHAAAVDSLRQQASCMTEEGGALHLIVHHRLAMAGAALMAFEQRWAHEALVMDQWFQVQASRPGPDAVEVVRQLLAHPAFTLSHPNRARSVLGAFANANPTGFHRGDGSGYRLMVEQVAAIDALNPQLASRLLGAFNRWRRLEPARQALAENSLRWLSSRDGLSRDSSETLQRLLG